MDNKGRGSTTPYQFYIDDKGRTIEDCFGEITVDGEKLEELKTGRSVEFIGSRQCGKEPAIIKYMRYCEEQDISIIEGLEKWKRAMFDESIIYGRYDPLNKIKIYDNNHNIIGMYSFDVEQLVREHKEKEYEKHNMKMMSYDINKNQRIYYDESAFDPYINGWQVHCPLKPNKILSDFLYETRYGVLRKEIVIPHIKLHIPIRRGGHKHGRSYK